MNRGSILHGRSGLGSDTPVPLQLELQTAPLIGLDRRRAQALVQSFQNRQFEPAGGLRFFWVKWGRRSSNIESRLCTSRRNGTEPWRHSFVLDQLPQIARRSLIGLARPLARIDTKRIPGARHSDVKQAPLLLLVQRFVIRLGQRIGIPQFPWEGYECLLVRRRKGRRQGAQNEDMPKLKPLGSVDRHQANRVFVLIRPQRYDAIRLAKIAEVVDEFFKVRGLVDLLLLPVLDKMQGCLQDR